ncbi:HAMP domain-containing histidine kinase [Clostridium botulinum]|uniref:histidine kinase n=1 Tax=Clostridium botulinum (strain Okra / Type B1) TaxID=498213 RepID=B1IFB7_CLOBK|nr:HAMP domain-containing sensor histidine kinase [Clostridium botulinum]ACA44396.1 sensor histidine kinase [Clostridium botulinum B1 str. Okra]MBD5561643.1 HAMP domain-containing histidine kinase [Clostridium botulinum]MBD5565311.1 HAMP domain-containing histidine kinase [Clostridium botulinum]MBD5570684.1 HAMP domain-containing histidine kinase [Clostridium botulinum]MBD5574795.1 HAMP domain-containing histidine kinase [Clostridium botulinum]
MLKYFRNPEIKELTFKFSIIFILFAILTTIFIKAELNKLNKDYINQNTLIVGNILSKHPELEDEVILSLNSNKDARYNEEKNYKIGKKVLEKYSYDENLDIYKNPILNNFSMNFIYRIIIYFALAIFIIYIIIYDKFKYFYKKAEIFTEASEDIMEGHFSKFIDENKEGDFYILSSKFNLMSNRLEESLLNLKKEKIFLKNIISDISHQLKTPLSSLIMFNELMKDENMPIEDRKNFLKLSDEQLRRMEWLIINLLKIGRLEAGVVEFRRENNPLYVTVNKALAGLSEKAKEKSQHVIVDIDEDVYFKHDMDWTAEAISNIIKNSIEHTNNYGQIKISCEETPISLTISIKDNGEGIPEKLQNKIFERFYKGENSVNPSSIGIGLSLTKSIIESQNGSIIVESEMGEGTEFIITFLKTIV